MPQGDVLRKSVIDRLETVLGLCAGTLLMILMMITTVDVIARYVFNSPVRGAFELTELMLVVLIYAGLPLVSHHQEHIVVDILEERMSRGVRRVLDVLANVASAVCLGGMAWLLVGKAQRLARDGDYTSVLHVPYMPFVWAMVVLVALTALIHLMLALRPVEPARGEVEGTV